MPATIKSALLVKTLLQHLKSKTSISVNFTFTPDIIKVQSSGEFIFDTFITGDYTNDMTKSAISIQITNAVQLLQADDGFTTITPIGDGVVVFDQDKISIPFLTTYDERIDISFSDVERQGKVSVSDITSITSRFRNLVNISKSLDVGVPPIVITGSQVYCLYSNSMYIENVPVCLPDMEVPYNTFSNLSRNLTGSSVNVLTDSGKKILMFQVGNESLAMTTYKRPNMELISSLEAKLTELSYLGDIDISIIRTLENLFKCFPRESVTLTTYEDNTLGIMFSVASGKSVRAGTKDIMSTFNIVINTTQFDALYRVFKESPRVEISYGRDIVCFKGTSGKRLVLSGMTF